MRVDIVTLDVKDGQVVFGLPEDELPLEQPALFNEKVEAWRTDDDLTKFGVAMDLKDPLPIDELADELLAMKGIPR